MNNYERAAVLDNAQLFILYICFRVQNDFNEFSVKSTAQNIVWLFTTNMLLGCCNFSNKPFVEFNLVKLTNLSYVLECFYYFLSFSHCKLTTILLTLEVDLSKTHNVF